LFIKKLFITLFFVLPIMFMACSETPTDAGAGLVEQDKIDVKTFDSSVDPVEVTASTEKRTINLGISRRLLTGRRDNVEAGTLIRFNITLADTFAQQINSGIITIDTAYITMIKDYAYGPNEEPLDFYVYKLNSPWLSATFNSDSIGTLSYDNTSMLSGLSIEDTVTRIDIQPQLALSWVRAAADTSLPVEYGAYIRPTEASNRVVGYHSVSAAETLTPRLTVVYRNTNGDRYELLYPVFADLSFVTGEIPAADPSVILLQGGLEIASRLRFDLTSIPEHAIINRAELILTKNTDLTRSGDNYTNSITAFLIPDSLKPDSVSSSVILNPAENNYTGDITFYVQNWVRDRNNAGLLLTATDRFIGVDLFALYGPEADAALRPRLTITYTIK
jgi:hypothetical protein